MWLCLRLERPWQPASGTGLRVVMLATIKGGLGHGQLQRRWRFSNLHLLEVVSS